METESLLSFSRELATCLFPDPENLVHTHLSQLFMIYFNIIPMSSSSKWSL